MNLTDADSVALKAWVDATVIFKKFTPHWPSTYDVGTKYITQQIEESLARGEKPKSNPRKYDVDKRKNNRFKYK